MKTFQVVAVFLMLSTTAFSQGRVKPITKMKPVSVGNTVTTRTSASGETTSQIYRNVQGTVRVSTQCGTYIEVKENGELVKIAATNLPDSFNKDGSKIILDYTEVKGESVQCDISKAVAIENVKAQTVR